MLKNIRKILNRCIYFRSLLTTPKVPTTVTNDNYGPMNKNNCFQLSHYIKYGVNNNIGGCKKKTIMLSKCTLYEINDNVITATDTLIIC